MKLTRPAPLALLALAGLAALASAAGAARDAAYTRDFDLAGCTFASIGDNPFFPLHPGSEVELVGREGRRQVELTIEVLEETLVIGGVETRVVEERETHDGELVEVSRNYFAECQQNGSVFYFGEDVDLYEGGAVVSHAGSWRHGENGARAGLQMPGLALLGSRYFQEQAPGVAMDRAEIVSVGRTVPTTELLLRGCIRILETSSLEPGSELKAYCPGFGLVRDDTLELVTED